MSGLQLIHVKRGPVGKWLFHYTKHHRANQLQEVKHPVEYLSSECTLYVKEVHAKSSIQYSKRRSRGRIIYGRRVLAEPEVHIF